MGIEAQTKSKSSNCYNIHDSNVIIRSSSKASYLKVSDDVFKDVISRALVGEEEFIRTINTSDQLAYVRTYAQLLNNILYLQLE